MATRADRPSPLLGCSPAQASETLQKVLDSRTFRLAPKSRHFLEFVPPRLSGDGRIS